MQGDWVSRRFQQQSTREGDQRSPFQRDKARVLHSAAFRRLQAKTQVLGIGIGDFYRTRLTHSLEASQIGQGIVAQLQQKCPELSEQLHLDAGLVEAICLAHDIGHPPFGHGGEVALNYMMRDQGGFEGNGQTFRIVNKLEPYTQQNGMNLCRRSILGLVKYPGMINKLHRRSPSEPASEMRAVKAADWHPPKGLYFDDQEAFDWLLAPLSHQDRETFQEIDSSKQPYAHSRTRHKSIDCSIMELADDIAYCIHDLEDAIVMGIINQQHFREEVLTPILDGDEPWFKHHMPRFTEQLFSPHHYERKDAIGGLVNSFVSQTRMVEKPEFSNPLLRFNAVLPESFQRTLSIFKDFVLHRVILKSEIQHIEYKGQQVVMSLFTAFSSDPERLLPNNTKQRWYAAEENGRGLRVIADYISGMTDDFASRLYNNLFTPKSASLNQGHQP